MGLFGKSKSKTLCSFLKMNPDEIYSLNYEKISEETNEKGGVVYKYKANLNRKELGIFDYIELLCWTPDLNFSNQSFHLIFRHRDEIMIPNQVKDMTNLLASTFGPDQYDEKNFTDQEKALVNQGYWTGRSWLFDHEGKNKGNVLEGTVSYGLILNYDPEERLSLTVMNCEELIRICKE